MHEGVYQHPKECDENMSWLNDTNVYQIVICVSRYRDMNWSLGTQHLHSLGAFAKLPKANIRHVMFIFLSVWMEQLGSHSTNPYEIWYLNIFFFRKSVQKIKVASNPEQNNGHFTWGPVYIYYHSWIKIDQLDVTCFIVSLFNAQHVSNVSTSIFRSLRIIVDLFHVLYCSGSACIRIPHHPSRTTP